MNADYAFRISGRVPPALTAALEPLKTVETSADTLLVGPVTDRAALHGYIAHFEALGLELVELRRPPAGDDSGGHGCPTLRSPRRWTARERDGGAVALVEPHEGAESHPAGHERTKLRVRQTPHGLQLRERRHDLPVGEVGDHQCDRPSRHHPRPRDLSVDACEPQSPADHRPLGYTRYPSRRRSSQQGHDGVGKRTLSHTPPVKVGCPPVGALLPREAHRRTPPDLHRVVS